MYNKQAREDDVKQDDLFCILYYVLCIYHQQATAQL